MKIFHRIFLLMSKISYEGMILERISCTFRFSCLVLAVTLIPFGSQRFTHKTTSSTIARFVFMPIYLGHYLGQY